MNLEHTRTITTNMKSQLKKTREDQAKRAGVRQRLAVLWHTELSDLVRV